MTEDEVLFKPHIIEEIGENNAYGIMLVELRKCPICKKWMLTKGIFPAAAYGTDRKAQLERAGWVSQSHSYDTMGEICVECERSGKETFKCCLCGKEQKTSEITDSFGKPAEFLCKSCYSTTPAKIWDEKISRLYDKHRYDYE